jgi:hypothetical protein
MLDELVAHFVDRTAKEGSFFFWRDDVVDVFVEPGSKITALVLG